MGVKRKGITIVIGGETDELVRALKNVDNQVKKTKSALSDIKGLLKYDHNDVDMLSQRYDYLKQAIEQTEERLRLLRQGQDRLSEGTKEWDSLQREIYETENKLKELTTEYDTFGNLIARDIKATSLQDLRTQCDDIKNKLREIEEVSKKDPFNSKLLTQEQAYIREAIEKTKEKYVTLLDTQSQFERGSDEWRELQHEILLTAEDIKDLEKKYKDFGSVATQQVDAVVNKMAGIGEKLKDVGGKLTTTVTVPIATAFVASAKEAIDWESAFTGVMKTVDETATTTYDDLKKSIGEIATTTASSREEIAGVMEIAGQLGVSADDITEFTEVMVKLGDTTNLSAESAAEDIAQFAHVTHMSLDEVDKLGATIVDLGNNTATTEADIVSMATRIASAGHQIGLSDAQILGYSAALSSVGLEAQAGGTAFSKAMVKMQTAVETGYTQVHSIEEKTGMTLRELELLSANNSSEFKKLADSMGMTKTELDGVVTAGTNLNNFAEVANMTTEEFVNLYNNDVSSALDAFIAGLGDTETHGESTIAMLDDMGFKEMRLSDTLRRLANDNENVTATVDLATAAWGENSAMNEEAALRYDTMAAKLSQTKERVKMLASDIGERLYPYIDKMIGIVEKAVQWFDTLSDSQKDNIVTIGLVIAAIGPFLSALGSLLTNVKVVWTAFKGLSAFLGFAGTGGLIAAIGLIIGVGVLLIQNWDKVVAAANWMKEKIVGVVDKIKQIWNSVVDTLSRPITTVVNWVTGGDSSVKRYASAYERPVMFTRPTVLQTPTGNKMFGDGNGAEIVMGMNKLRELVGNSREVNNNITIYQQPNQSPRELANMLMDELTAREQRAAIGAI